MSSRISICNSQKSPSLEVVDGLETDFDPSEVSAFPAVPELSRSVPPFSCCRGWLAHCDHPFASSPSLQAKYCSARDNGPVLGGFTLSRERLLGSKPSEAASARICAIRELVMHSASVSNCAVRQHQAASVCASVALSTAHAMRGGAYRLQSRFARPLRNLGQSTSPSG